MSDNMQQDEMTKETMKGAEEALHILSPLDLIEFSSPVPFEVRTNEKKETEVVIVAGSEPSAEKSEEKSKEAEMNKGSHGTTTVAPGGQRMPETERASLIPNVDVARAVEQGFPSLDSPPPSPRNQSHSPQQLQSSSAEVTIAPQSKSMSVKRSFEDTEGSEEDRRSREQLASTRSMLVATDQLHAAANDAPRSANQSNGADCVGGKPIMMGSHSKSSLKQVAQYGLHSRSSSNGQALVKKIKSLNDETPTKV